MKIIDKIRNRKSRKQLIEEKERLTADNIALLKQIDSIQLEMKNMGNPVTKTTYTNQKLKTATYVMRRILNTTDMEQAKHILVSEYIDQLENHIKYPKVQIINKHQALCSAEITVID